MTMTLEQPVSAAEAFQQHFAEYVELVAQHVRSDGACNEHAVQIRKLESLVMRDHRADIATGKEILLYLQTVGQSLPAEDPTKEEIDTLRERRAKLVVDRKAAQVALEVHEFRIKRMAAHGVDHSRSDELNKTIELKAVVGKAKGEGNSAEMELMQAEAIGRCRPHALKFPELTAALGLVIMEEPKKRKR